MEDGTRARAMEYDMSDFARSCVQKYLDEVKTTTGETTKLRDVSTPSLAEDHKETPAGMPAASGPCAECPW